MEHVLGLIYQDLKTPIEKRVIFRDEATVRYSAELGRELKALQLELTARKIYQSGERWDALTAIWDTCLVNEQEREQFRSAVDQDDTTFSEKLERIQAEIETCRVRFSRSNAVYKLMMTRSKHIERMKSFEHSASDPKRLFRSSFQLVEEEKFRRRAYPTLLKLERTLLEAIDAFEKENGERFMYEGVPYYDTLQSEIEKRHVNETVFAKFTPVIAAPTRSQTIQIMGRPVSPISKSSLSVPKSKPSQNSRNQSSATRSAETRRSNTLPDQTTSSKTSQKSNKSSKHEEDTNSNDVMSSLKPYLHSHQRETSGASTLSLSSTHSLKSKSSASSLTMTSAPVSASNSPKIEVVNHNGSYFTSFNTSTTNLSTSSVLSASSSSSSLSSLMSIPSVQVQPLPVSPKQELKTLSKSPSGVSINSTSLKPSTARSLSPGKRVGV
ncbi:hypothetical protein BGZ49_004765 [Haplosporangium sp. Z 27]|nr:hypothetical protein BGZ49_004765 [Haplosporangium sp. Z 27]